MLLFAFYLGGQTNLFGLSGGGTDFAFAGFRESSGRLVGLGLSTKHYWHT